MEKYSLEPFELEQSKNKQSITFDYNSRPVQLLLKVLQVKKKLFSFVFLTNC